MKYIVTIINILIASAALAQQSPVLNAFKQGTVKGGGNCASVAAIKAGIHRYGVRNVFTMTREKGTDRFDVMLRSGGSLSLTKAEIDLAIAGDGFALRDKDPLSIDIKNYADTCFAVMVKNHQLRAPKASFSDAMDDLNDGFNVGEAVKLLGLDPQRIRPNVNRIRTFNGAVMGNGYHAVYTNGAVYDEAKASRGYRSLGAFRWSRMGCKCAWLLCGPSGAYWIK